MKRKDMTEDLKRIQADIKAARAWAKKYFNAYVNEEVTPSNPFAAKLTFEVTFTAPDIVQVCPVTFGKPMIVGLAEYRLCWKSTGLYWKGGPCLRPDLVSELRVE